MACVSGTKIVDDGLLFHYDMDNVQKSWKGKPTTNLTTDTPSMNGWAGNYTVIDSETKTFDIQTTQTNAATTSAWRTWYWDVSAHVGSTVTISGDVEFVSETDATFLHITIGQGNTGSFPYHIAGSPTEDRVQVSTKPVEKISMSWSGVINATGIVGFTQWINNVTANGGNAILRISKVQIEVNSFATPFVNGTRSNTEALVDISKGGNTITANSLVYNSDDTFEFNGSSDYITTGFTRGTLGNTLTMFSWYKYTGTSGRGYTPIFGGLEPGTGTEFFIGKNTGNTNIGLQDGNYDGNFVTGSNAFDGNWHNIVYTYDNGTGKIYLDGVLKNTGSFTKCNDAEQIVIGYESEGGGYYFLGNISNVSIYNKALSAKEVKQNFEATRVRYGL